MAHNARDGERRTVALGHEHALQHHRVEALAGVHALGQVAVQLDQHPQVRVLTLRGLAAHLPVILVVDVNAHSCLFDA